MSPRDVLQIGWTALLSIASSQQGQAPPDVAQVVTEVADGEAPEEAAHPVPEVVMAGPVPVINVLEPFEEPVTASHDHPGHDRRPVESLPHHPALRQRVAGGVGRVLSVAKFW